jgi:hypothetical protein
MIEQSNLDHWFAFHAADTVDKEAYTEIREGAKRFAEVVLRLTPSSADQTVAIRMIRDAMHTAVAARACGGE